MGANPQGQEPERGSMERIGEAAPLARAPAPLRFVSAASLFDGHDAAINMIRRLLQAHGAEVVHLGHNRSVADIVRAAIQEDADAIAVSSYQGGHNEYFAYMVDMLRELHAEHIRVIVGGGGTIAPAEIGARAPWRREDLHTRRMAAVRPQRHDRRCVRSACARRAGRPYAFGPLNARDHAHIARSITALEVATATSVPRSRSARRCRKRNARAGDRHYRHRWRRQEFADRRAAAALRARVSPTGKSPSSPSTRHGGAPAARCWAIASA
jgi:methylmalonyl-CoA mutase cobalamin-binding domain/chain